MPDDLTENKTPEEIKPDEPYNPEPEKPKSKPHPLKKPLFDLSTPEGKKKALIWGGSLALSLLLIVIITMALAGKRVANDVSILPTALPTPVAPPTPASRASLLDGVIVSNELATRHPLGIMIENHPEARPQTGLYDASIIYEAITEGGITRFMAVYGHALPNKVGPVRSARPVFIDFAEEFTPGSAYYAHAGGSPQAYDKIRGDKIYDMDQFSIGAKAFQRFPKTGVASEHTLYTYPSKLYDVAKSLGYRTDSDFKSWLFKEDAEIAVRPEAQSITIPFSSKTYEVKYVYDKASNSYKRYLNGVEHKDAESGKTISPKNVVIHFADYVDLDTKGRQNVKVLGEGKAKVFVDGKAIEATWKKPSSPSRSIYTDSGTGKEIEFNRGQTWVEVPKASSTVTVQ